MLSLLQRLFQRQSSPPFDKAVWAAALESHDFLRALGAAERDSLQHLASDFLLRKAITPAKGSELSEADLVSIAAQACLPVLHLGLAAYDDFSEVIVYPGEFLVKREHLDDYGVIHDASGALAGETMPGGPVVISWHSGATVAASIDGFRTDTNVVIHEFAHKLDLANGDADGVPKFYRSLHSTLRHDRWIDTLETALEDLRAMVDALEARFPRHIDPESDEGQALYATLPLDAYAAQDLAEFFAVSSEAYFVAPESLRDAFTELFDLLDQYYRPKSVKPPL